MKKLCLTGAPRRASLILETMKRVRINTGNIGLVFKKGDYQRVITAGVYWLSFSEVVQVYNLAHPFQPEQELNLLLKDEELRNELIVVEISDNEIGLRFENGIFKTIMLPGRYAYWKGVIDFAFIKADLSKVEITENISRQLLKRPILLPYLRAVSVGSHEKGILFIDGKYKQILERGEYFYWNNSIPIMVLKADMRTQQLELSGQEMLTKDKAALRVNFTAQYKVTDIEKALVENKDFEKQLHMLMQLALREFIGTLTLDELLEKKEAVAEYILSSVKEKATELGVKVGGSGIRDIILPGEVKDIMNQVLVAEKKAQANVVTRREETASTRSLLNTAKLMEDNSMLFKLKEMEYTEKIAEKINSISLSGGNQVVDQLREIFSR
jgi:regulator of protease activity HflC (stomatin/prohibitin superfamily)